MSLFDLDPTETQNLVDHATVNGFDPRNTPAGFFQGVGTGAMSGIKTGLKRQVFAADPETRDQTTQDIISLRPDPRTVGTAGQMLYGMLDPLTVFAGSIAESGPFAVLGAANTTDVTTKTQEAVHVAEGMDPKTARELATWEGIFAGGGMVMPAAVSGKLLTRAVSGAAIMNAFGIGSRAAMQSTLKNAGYADMAAQYKPITTESLLADTLMGAFFGGVMGPRAREALRPSDLDAALTVRAGAHAEIDTPPGFPADAATRAAHTENFDRALSALMEGRDFTADAGVTDGTFVDNPARAGFADDVAAAVEDHMGPDFRALQSELEARGLPTDLDLYSIDERSPVRFTDRVKGMLDRYEQGGDNTALVDELTRLRQDLEERAASNDAARGGERVRGELYVRERLMRAERQGDITPEQHGLAKWLLDQNPSLANDLAISVRNSNGRGSGTYNPYERVVTLFKGRGNDMTAAHEILHHSERMMPEDVRRGVAAEWARNLQQLHDTAAEAGDQKTVDAVAMALKAAAGNGEAYNQLARDISSGKLPLDFYQYVNPSEYWAVNAARLVRERAGATGWVAKAVQWMREFVRKVQSAFGINEKAAVIRGLDAVLSGDGELTGRMLSHMIPTARSGSVFYARDAIVNVLRTVKQLVADAKTQSSWRNWYQRHEQTLRDLFGSDAELFQKLLDVTSQAASVKANVGLAIKAYRQLLAGEPFVGYLPAVIKNLERVRDQVAVRGQKIGEYAKANAGEAEGIAVDRHIAQLLFGVDRPTAAQVAVAKERIIAVAQRLGWEPRQVQAALWAFNQVRNGIDPAKVVSYDTVLLGKADTIAAIRAEFGRGEEGSVPAGGPASGGTSEAGGSAGRTGEGLQGISAQTAENRLFHSIDQVTEAVAKEGGKVEEVVPIDSLVASDRIPTITLQDLVGKRIFPTIADRTRAGALFTGIDGAKLQAAVPLPGGPLFPLRETSMDAGVVWADRGKHVVSKKEGKLDSGANYMMVMLGDQDMHQSNRTVAKAFMAQLDAYVADGRISQDNLRALEELVRSSPTTDKTVQAYIDKFPGFSDAQAFHAYAESLTFEASKRLTKILSSKGAEEHGAPSFIRILDATREPSLAGGRWGDGVLVLKLNPDKPMITLGEQGTQPHPDYPYGVQGEVVGKLEAPVNYEVLWKDWVDRAHAEALQRNAMSDAPKEGFRPNTLRAFSLALPELEITQQLVDRIGPLKQGNIDSPRQAALATDMALDRWSTSSQKVNEGGASPQEFVDAVNHSSAKVVLNEYTTAEVKKAIKDGTMTIYNLGGAKGPDGKAKFSGIWFALKKGPADTYGLDIPELTDNEVTLTAVINNEQGARGIGGPAVLLKALQEGATVLDCFAVKSTRFPDGFLPSLYREFGFEVVGEVPFAKEYYSPQKLADAERFWRESTPGWDPAKDGYPPVVIMKWRGSDEERAGILDRYLRSGSEGVLAGRNQEAAAADWAVIGRDAETAAGAAGPAADAGRTARNQGTGDRASLASRARSVVQGVGELGNSEIRNLGLDAGDVGKVREKLGLDAEAANQALDERPDLEIPGDDGAVTRGHDALMQADAEITQAERDSQGYDAAVACELRGGA